MEYEVFLKPARIIYTGIRRIDSAKLEKTIREFYSNTNDGNIFRFTTEVNHNICDMDH